MSESNTSIISTTPTADAKNSGSGSNQPNVTFISGVSLPDHIHDAATSLQHARQDGFDYVVTALPNTVPLLSATNDDGALRDTVRRTDVTRLESKWWSTSIVGMVTDPPHWKADQLLEGLTSTAASASVRKTEANKIFWGMMEWASHMNIPAVILPSVPLTEKTGLIETASDEKNKAKNSKLDEDEDMFAKDDESNNQSQNNPGKKISINNPSAKEYARLLANLATSSICTSSHVQLWIRVPLTLPDLQAYQLLLARCDHSPSVGCLIHINTRLEPAELPAIVRALHAFLGGGNVKAVSWDTSIFLQNKKGYPTLSKSHQFVFSLLFGRLGRTLRTLVEGGVDSSNPSINAGGSSLRLHHIQYLRHLRSRAPLLAKLDSEEGILEAPYLDSLQSPLQPLGDHLEYQTYETFEKDPVKYKRYGEAVAFALEDGIENDKFAFLGSTRMSLGQLKQMNDAAFEMENENSFEKRLNDKEMIDVNIYQVTILVVGAGRGPLVREAIAAVSRVSASWTKGAKDKRRKALHAKIVAIEKNPSAVLYLQSLKGSDPSWNGGQDYDRYSDGSNTNLMEDGNIVIPGTSNVNVIGCDMREATSHPILKRMIQNEKARADIVVSELLGSFGDNELSPECLDGVQHCGILKDSCVSVPQSYTAFIAPVSSARLHSEARTQSCLPLNTNEGPASPSVGMQRAMETPYVVRSHAASQTHNERACWTFSHPHPSKEKASSDMDTSGKGCDEDTSNPSAKAAEDIDNDRHAHISFRNDPTNGAGMGCGYGAVDPEAISMASDDPKEILTKDDTTVTIHGFMGSFHSELYESPAGKSRKMEEERSSVISIAPHSFSVGMFSWFPLYFPLKEPLRVPPGATVNCSIWRRSDDARVWYEWCAEVVDDRDGAGEACLWAASSIHNPGGRSYHVKK
mmetsp:Transcript_32280/g.67864  ORF Transcript_32280/g.67864 Transcript_32280/m.67864 type:complete len:915 (+) Transcript_32280:77-2821(+)